MSKQRSRVNKRNIFIDDDAELSGEASSDEDDNMEPVDNLFNDSDPGSQGSPPPQSAFTRIKPRHSVMGPDILKGLDESDDEETRAWKESRKQQKRRSTEITAKATKKKKTSSSSSSSSSSSELAEYMREQTRGIDNDDLETDLEGLLDMIDAQGEQYAEVQDMEEEEEEEQQGFFSGMTPPDEDKPVEEEIEDIGVGHGKDKEEPLLQTKAASYADKDSRNTCFSITIQGPEIQKWLDGAGNAKEGWEEGMGSRPPTILMRMVNSLTLRVGSSQGQWEKGASGNLHFQGILIMTSVAKGGSEGKISTALLAQKLQTCVVDDKFWNKPERGTLGDDETWGDKPQHFFLQALHKNGSRTALINYCTDETKRFYGKPFNVGRFANVGHGGEEQRQGGVSDQFAAMIAAGGTYQDCVNHAGGSALHQIRNLQHLIQLRDQERQRIKMLRVPGKCKNELCHLHDVSEQQTQAWATRLNITAGEMKAKLDAPCEIEVLYVSGPGGTGKSTFTEAQAGAGHFKKPVGPWWGTANAGGYAGESSVVLHDVDGKTFNSLGELKQAFDCKITPVALKGGFTSLLADRYFVDSNYDLLEWIEMTAGPNILSKWDYSAIKRRFNTIYQIEKKEEEGWTTTRVALKTYEKYEEEHIARAEVKRNNTGQRKKVEPPSYTYDIVPITNGQDGYRTRLIQGQEEAFDALFPKPK